MSGGPQVRVAQGELLGKVSVTPAGNNYFSFQGIPYAKPPVGTLRFKAAKPADPWDGVRDATAEGNICAQIQTFPHETEFNGGEDCLFINVYTPTLEGEFLPVMVWSHAGVFSEGSGNTDIYGPDFLVEKDVVVVTFNYRTGPLGFLSLNIPEVPGNAGLKDQVLALKWVKENIGSFGGNSHNVTLFGVGAGGASSSYLTLSPISKDLVNKAIFQSGTSLNSFALVENPLDNAKELARILGCESNDADEIFLFLQAVSVRDLVETARKFNINFAPVIEKEFPILEAFLTEHPFNILSSGRGAKIPIVVGRTAEEAAIKLTSNFSIDGDLRNFIPKNFDIDHNSEKGLELAAQLKQFYFNDAHVGMDTLPQYLNLLGDKEYAADIHRYIQTLVKTSNEPVYSYTFSYVGSLNLLRKVLDSFGLKKAGHLDELGYLFNVTSLKDTELSSSDVMMRDTIVELWTNFAKTGNPTPDENRNLTVTWLPVSVEHQYYLDIDKDLILATNADKERMELWDGWYAKYYKAWSSPGNLAKAEIEDNRVEDSPVNARFEYAQPEPDCSITANVDEPEEVDAPEAVQETDFKEELSELTEVPSPKIEITTPEDSPVESVESPESQVASINDPVSNGNSTAQESCEDVQRENGIDKGLQDRQEEQEVIQKIDNVVVEEEKNIEKPQKRFEVKVTNGAAKDIIRANDPPADDLPKNIGVNKFVNFFESLGGKKK